MKTKLTLILLIPIFIFGCVESNPHLGKWHVSEDGENIVIEILESGNWLFHDSDGIETGQWFATDGGIVIKAADGTSMPAFVHEDSLHVNEDRRTYTYKRVK
tara:strand:- start:118 stop:423 length:306 start_codon:yes stop_codon:yes gene_type:complete